MAQFWIFILWLSFLCTTVLASVGASGYETLFFYYAYKMDYITNDGDSSKMKIAIGCKPEVADRKCNLAEFINHVRLVVEGKPGLNFGGEGKTEVPDMKTAERIRIWGYGGTYNAENMLRDHAENPRPPKHAEIMQEITKIVQSAAGRGHDLSNELDFISDLLKNIQRERVADITKAYQKELEFYNTAKNVNIVMKLKKDTNGNLIGEEIDWDETLKQSTGASKAVKLLIKKSQKKETGHGATLKGVKACIELVFDLVKSCPEAL